MKKTLFALFATASMLGSTLFAALPPLSQTAKEIEAIVTSQELSNKLESGGPIQLIKRIDDDTYLVLTTNQKILIDVVYNQKGAVGPQQFTLVFNDPQPLDRLDRKDRSGN